MSGYTSLGKKGSGGIGSAEALEANANSVGPFGTTIVSGMSPTGQAAFTYIINSTQWTTGTNGTGASVTTSEGVMTCTSGGSLSGSATIRLSRNNKYRAGQGVMARLTAIFGTGASDTMQLAGVSNPESGFWFCASGSTSFGILHRETSKREIRSFTVTSPPAGAATLTVTLAGDVKTISINGGGSANQTSYQISQVDYSNVGAGWTAEAIDGIVYFLSKTPGPRGGTFSILNGGSSIATAATLQAGVLPTETFISQSSWNVDTMDGNGPSRFVLDRTKGNVYGIGYQYLGFGNPSFSIEDSETGLLRKCHMIERTNTSTSVVVRNPSMTATWEAINSGSQATSVSVKGASAGVFTEGTILRNIGIGFSAATVKSTISSVEIPILTIRANTIFNGMCCYGEISPTNLNVANDAGSSAAGKLLKIFVYKNCSLGGPVNYTNVDTRSMVAYDTSATSFTKNSNTQLMKTLIVAANSGVDVDLSAEGIFVTTGDSLTITAQRVSNDVDNAAVSISWYEDQ